MSNVWKKEDEINPSSTSKDLCYQVQTKKGSVSLNQNQAKKLDLGIVPPCSKVLHQKIKLCIYVASICKKSLSIEPVHLPATFGWAFDEDETCCDVAGDVVPKIVEVVKEYSCTSYGEFSNSKIQRRLLQNNSDTGFDHSSFFFFNFL